MEYIHTLPENSHTIILDDLLISSPNFQNIFPHILSSFITLEPARVDVLELLVKKLFDFGDLISGII